MRSAGDVLSAMVRAFNSGRVDNVEAFVDDEYVDHQGLQGQKVHGAAGFAQVVDAARRGYEDLTVVIEDLIEGGDRAAARLRWTGTRVAGEAVVRETLEIVRVSEGRAIEHWGGRS